MALSKEFSQNYNFGDVQDYMGNTKSMTYFIPKEQIRRYNVDAKGTLEMSTIYTIPTEELDMRGLFTNGNVVYNYNDPDYILQIECGIYILGHEEKLPENSMQLKQSDRFIRFNHTITANADPQIRRLTKHRMLLFTKEKVKKYSKNGKANGIYIKRLRGGKQNPTLTMVHEDRYMWYRIITPLPTKVNLFNQMRLTALPINFAIISRLKMNHLAAQAVEEGKTTMDQGNKTTTGKTVMTTNKDKTQDVQSFIDRNNVDTLSKKNTQEQGQAQKLLGAGLEKGKKRKVEQEKLLENGNKKMGELSENEQLRLINDKNIARKVNSLAKTGELTITMIIVFGLEHK